MLSVVNEIQRNIKRNTILFIVNHTRKQCNFIIKILNLLIKIKQIKIETNDEEKLVNDFRSFNKILLNFSKSVCGTTLGIYSNQHISHELLKSNIDLNNRLYELFLSIESMEKNVKAISKDKLNSKYIEKYTESFDKLLNNSYNVFKENIKRIKSFCTNNPYVEDLEQILDIIKSIQDKFLN